MLVDLVRQFLHKVLVQLLLSFLDFSKQVHNVSFPAVCYDTISLFDHLFSDVDITAHIL